VGAAAGLLAAGAVAVGAAAGVGALHAATNDANSVTARLRPIEFTLNRFNMSSSPLVLSSES
jgi:hypothetical protein